MSSSKQGLILLPLRLMAAVSNFARLETSSNLPGNTLYAL
jgi:hypothetical protein